ncbi:MAG: hypothetical protein NTAFB01_18410 [Nitrospira sp.]
MADKYAVASGKVPMEHWDASDQSLLSAVLMATPTQRIAWLEEALQLAYATGALKPRRMMTKEEWDAMGSSNL